MEKTKDLKDFFRRAWKERKSRLILSFALFLPALFLHILRGLLPQSVPAFLVPPALVLLVLSYILAGHQVLLRAWQDLRRGRWMTVYFLMSLATLGAIALGEWAEAAAVMLFYELGEYAQQLAVKNSQRSIAALLELAANTAVLWREGEWQECDPEEAEIGERLLIGAGRRVAIDCVLTKGCGDVDESALTGESLPRSVEVGDKLLAGTLNLSATLEAEVCESYESSALSRILELTEEASMHKAKTEQRIARFAKIYTPAMVFLALAMLLLPPLVWAQPWRLWFQRSLNLLVVSCPCALVLSVPLSYFAGLGLASSQGILVKGSDVMERFADCRAIFFDKTGTLSTATLELSGESVCPAGEGEGAETLLALAAALEKSSEHPIARALRRAAEKAETGPAGAPQKEKEASAEAAAVSCPPDKKCPKIPETEISEIEELPGRGLSGLYGGRRYYLGNARLMDELGLALNGQEESSATTVWMAREAESSCELLVCFHFRDTLRSNAGDVLSRLHRMGLKKLILLSGDRLSVVCPVAEKLHFDAAEGELLPGQKLAYLETYRREKGGSLAYVGDGINDAPALALADVGIAMGGIGSDAAIEAADIVLMRDELEGIPAALAISRKTVRNASENISLALGIKFLVIVLSFFGLGGLWAAVFADVGVTLLAVGNALRLHPRRLRSAKGKG